MKNENLNTLLNHPEHVQLKSGNEPTHSPIYQNVKFNVAENVPFSEQHIYSRISNPTIRELELLLAKIQKREECVVFASGMAAISCTLLSLLKSGDHVIAFKESYKPGRIFIRDMLPQYGVQSSILSLHQLDELESCIIKHKTKLIHFESPTNPNLTIADIDFILALGKKHNVIISLDGTFAGIHQHTEFPVDIMVQSLSKFANGHGDVLVGSVSGRKDLLAKIKNFSIYQGATLDPHAAYLVLRGLKTYQLRYERQSKTAFEVASLLSQHPKIKKVYYPGFGSETEKQLAQKQMNEMGAMIAFEIDSSLGIDATAFCYRLKLIQYAVSLGGTESLICPTLLFFGDDLSPSDREEIGINKYSIRLSIGLEEKDDIMKDLYHALS